MAHKATFKVVVLWDDELRAAAKSLVALQDSIESEAKGEMSHETAMLYGQAINTCSAALFGIEDGAAIVVSSVPRRKGG